ncbi:MULTISPECIES: GNAT family N-acetyltransferase [Salimicrobium]|uniref:GNAT family N-acetyltransferase n=4 Tax=Salimicrobium TaxID=351195 RepID=A0AAC8T6J3_9BACI|nr:MULTISPECIES: GNAT family N-acetyltransferase [Salimicrobium]AKG04935.1 GNAT family N-acetyltransferase [Salimicrobium jeotgali]PBB06155.1 N-acetyltransferase [Salimicrobium humidisoli]SDX44126.1 Predicted N-acyltransferase, GNAT family [Salimicrobium album]SIS45468.1 Predicted N-acyltransferase, GNAT family [Salimicrobium salexigens]
MEIKTVSTEEERKDAYSVRRKVFIEEQNVTEEEEHDGLDEVSVHFVGYEDDQPVAAARLRIMDDYGKLERICVLKEHRGLSFGKQMIGTMEERVQKEGRDKAKLNAQTRAETFYESLGYRTTSDEFMDANIPHVTMEKSFR